MVAEQFSCHFPNSCPPDEAASPDGDTAFCRLINDPVSQDDVKSNYELGLPNSDSCTGRAVSMYTETRGAERLKASYPRFKDMRVAWLSPKPGWGLLRPSKKKRGYRHVDFWLYKHANRSEVVQSFIIDGEGSDN
jgi:hypothetical protein